MTRAQTQWLLLSPPAENRDMAATNPSSTVWIGVSVGTEAAAGDPRTMSESQWARFLSEAPLSLLEAELEQRYKVEAISRRMQLVVLEIQAGTVALPAESPVVSSGPVDATVLGAVQSRESPVVKRVEPANATVSEVAASSATKRRHAPWTGWHVQKQGPWSG